VIRAWQLLRWFCLSSSRKKKLKKRKQDASDSKSRLFVVETKTSQSTELFFLKEATKSWETSHLDPLAGTTTRLETKVCWQHLGNKIKFFL